MPTIRNTDKAYGLIAKTFHWTIALLILGLLSVGFYMADLDVSLFKFELYGWHKSIGILVLILALARLGWRTINPEPEALKTHAAWEKLLAKIAHVLLYLALFAMPLSGWLMSSSGDFPVSFFGLFEMPNLSPKNKALFELTKNIHEILALIIIAVVGLHVAGAFKHHFIDKDETLKRMSTKHLGFLGGAFLALIVGAFLATPVTLYGLQYVRSYGEGEQVFVSSPKSEVVARDSAWTINHEASHIRFEATQSGQGFTGSFDFDGKIEFDSYNLSNAKADITIDIASINTGSDDRDEQARGDEWFDVTAFPQAKFVTRSFESLGANHYIANGDLTIRGITLPIDLPFSLNITTGENQSQTADMKAELRLNRLDFGIGQGQWESAETIGNAVRLSISVQASQNQAVPGQ